MTKSDMRTEIDSQDDITARRYLYPAKTGRKVRFNRRTISIGGGSLAVVVFVLCGLFFAMPDAASGTSDASNVIPNDRQVKRTPRPPKEPGTFVPFPVRDDSPLTAQVAPAYEVVGEVVKRTHNTTPHAVTAVYQARPHLRRPAFVMSKFVPTTLIIYPENGIIKTRIQPQLTAAVYKK